MKGWDQTAFSSTRCAFAFAAALLLSAAPAASANDADTAFKAGDFQAAQTDYTARLQHNPKDSAALAARGTIELYRNDLSDAERDLQAASAAGDPTAARGLAVANARTDTSIYRISLPPQGTVVPLLTIDPLPVLPVTVNGVATNFFIDTGAPDIVLTADFAKRLHLVSPHVSSLKVGDAQVANVPANVLQLPPTMGPYRIGGIIGTGFLYRFLATIDYAHGLLVLRRKSDSAQIESAAQAKHADAVPMWLVGDHFVFATGHANGAAPALFNIDTGGAGFGVQLTKAQIDAAHITPDFSHVQKGRGGGGAATAAPFTANVTLGSTTVTSLPGLYFLSGDQYNIFPFTVGGTITHDFFRRMRVTFDFDAMRLLLQQ